MRPDRMSQIAAAALTRWRREFTLERFQAAVCDVVDDAMRRHQRIPAQITGAKARQW